MKTKIVLCCVGILANLVYADQQQQVSSTIYSGYTLPFPVSSTATPASIDSILPYGMVSAQDIYPLMTGYGLTALADQPSAPNPPGSYDSAFVPNPTTSTQYIPEFDVDKPAWLALGSMLTTIPASQLSMYYKNQPDIFVDLANLPALQPSTKTDSSTPFAANTPTGSNNYTYKINEKFGAPFFVGSLFKYIPQTQNPFGKYLAYQQNPGEVYISLVSGGLTPPPSVEQPNPDYLPQVRRLAAIQTGGVYALQNIFNRSMPIEDAGSNPLVQTLQGYPDANHIPKTPRDLEKFMATRRLDPQSGWYQHLQQASPMELQREQIYLQAEMLYELYQVHQTEEQNQMLLALSLLSQNYNNRITLNQQQQIAASSKTLPTTK